MGTVDIVDTVYDAVILAGGSARRLGGVDKPALRVGGRSLLAHVVAAVTDAGRVVVVGPHRPLDGVLGGLEVTWSVETPPGGGPVAAIAAGLAHVTADVVLVLAADLPAVAPAVPVLRAALAADPATEVALLVDETGRPNQLAAAWRRPALARALAALGDPAGAPVRALTGGAVTVPVADAQGWGRDCDTWPDVDAARAASPVRPRQR